MVETRHLKKEVSDNAYRGAHRIQLDDPIRQHTLHRVRDVDWFELLDLRAIQTQQLAIIAQPGADIDIGLGLYTLPPISSSEDSPPAENEDLVELAAINAGGLGQTETLIVNIDPTVFPYYLKVYDIESDNNTSMSDDDSPNCRIRVQYTLDLDGVSDTSLSVMGQVTDHTAGQAVPNTTVSLSCSTSDTATTHRDRGLSTR